MYALLFRNRWLAVVWVVLVLCAAFFIATRGLAGMVGSDSESVPAVNPSDDFARWAAEKPDNAETQEDDGRKKVEVRIYHDAPKGDGVSEDGEQPAAEAVSGEEGQTQPDGVEQ
ncbi:MAG: hypothetical protein RIS94_584 [Pseudomonadota bacterium]|jgi:hypothetical protein